jgi:sugar phosphate isomerase/epimerase
VHTDNDGNASINYKLWLAGRPHADEFEYKWTLDMAQLGLDVGTGIIHVIPGDQPDDGIGIGVATERGDLDAFIVSLREVVEISKRMGVNVGLEPIENQLVATADQTLRVGSLRLHCQFE